MSRHARRQSDRDDQPLPTDPGCKISVRNQTTTTPCLLIGDIGGTNARFALADPDQPGYSQEQTFRCGDFQTAEQAVTRYLEMLGAPAPDAICLAAAGPVVDGRVRFTNNNWGLDTRDLAKAFGIDRVRLLNDFAAIAYALPLLQEDDCLDIGLLPGRPLGGRDFTVGVLGPGTGLGAAGLVGRGGSVIPIVGEAGHLGFAPETDLQMQVLSQLRERFERVSDERLLSGPGLENIYAALCGLHDEPIASLAAADIFASGAANTNERASEALQLFFEVLGQAAGNLALMLGAEDGIYIAGGIVKRDPALLANSRFRTGFERKGRHRSLMEKIPTHVIMHPEPGLLGAGYCARSLLLPEVNR